jgi:hypothetical protein
MGSMKHRSAHRSAHRSPHRLLGRALGIATAVALLSGGLVVGTALPAQASAPPTTDLSLLKNPGFETLTAGSPASWSFVTLSGSSVGASDSTTSVEGSKGVTITNSGSGSSGEWRSASIAVLPDSILQLSSSARSTAVDGQVSLRITYSDGSTTVGSDPSDDVLVGDHAWTPLSLVSTVPHAAATAYVSLRLTGTGQAGFDWVDLEAPGQYNRVSNASAEVADSAGGPANWAIAGESGTHETALNPGFESSPAASGWWAAKWAGTSTLTAGAVTHHDGSNGAQIQSSDPASHAGWVNMNNGTYYDVTPNQTYTMSVFVNVASLGAATDGGAKVQVSALMRDSALSASSQVVAPIIDQATAGWQLIRLSFTPTGSWTKVRFQIELFGAGTVYVDSLSWSQTNWQRDPSFANKDSGKATVGWDTAQHLDGTHSLKVAITDDDYSAGWSSAAVPVRVGDFYRATGMLKTSAAVYGAYLLVDYYDASGTTLVRYSSAPQAGTQDWSPASVDSWAPGGAVSMSVSVALSASGTAWADTISVGQQSENKAVNPSNEYTVGLVSGVQGRAPYTWAGNGTSAVDTTVSHSGWKSLRSSGDSTDDQTGWIGQDVAVEAGKLYNYATWVKTDSIATSAALVAIFKKADGSVLQQTNVASISGTHGWTRIAAYAYTTPAAAVAVRLDVRLTGSGTAWFDDLDLEGPVSPHPTTLYTAADLAALQTKATTAGEGKDFIGVLKTQSDAVSLSALSDIAWNIDPWTSVMRGVGDGTDPTTAPAGSASVSIGVQVSGHGTVYVDQAKMDKILDQGRTQPVSVSNSGFETGSGAPDGWSLTTASGSATLASSTVVRASGGSRSARIQTGTLDSVATLALDSGHRISVSPGDQDLYQFDVRVDDPGVTVKLAVTYYDASGTALRTDKSSTGELVDFPTRTNFGMGTQTTGEAALWMGLQDVTYARKAKARLLYQLNEIHMWIVRHMAGDDPRSLAAFYSVTRTTDYLAQVYDAIAGAQDGGQPVISDGEDQEIRYLFGWIGSQFQNTRYYDTRDAAQQRNNITLDAHGALAMLAMVFPENTDAPAWYQSGMGGIEWMLANVVTADGAWPESSRYQGGILRTLLPVLVAARNSHPGDPESDFFSAATGDALAPLRATVKKLVSWFVTIQTPPDPVSYYQDPVDPSRRVTNVALTPGIDDANWEPTWFADLAWAASQYAATDSSLAGQLEWTWRRGGGEWSPEATPGNVLASFALVDPSVATVAPTLTSTSTDFAYQILRNDVGTSQEDYLLLEAGDYHIHGHYSHLGISLWAKGVPLLLDSGVVDYGQSLVQWYRRSSASNRIALYTDTALQNIKYKGPWNSTALTPTFTSGLDYVGGDSAAVAYADPDASIAARRHVFAVKDPFDAYVVWDDMRGVLPQYTGAASWLNAFSAQPVDYSGSLATVHGYKDVDLDIKYLNPGTTLTGSYFGLSGLGGTRYTSATGSTQINTQQSIKVPLAVSGGTVSSLMVLYPRGASDAGLTYTDVAVSGSPSGVRIVKVADSAGHYFVVAVNASDTAQSVSFANADSLKNAVAGATYAVSGGSVTVPLAANGIAILQVSE